MLFQYKDEELKRIQETQLELLQDFKNICEQLNLVWFMQGGSAIGSVRHSGFIPWDDDIDVGMLRKDYDQFIKEANKYIDVNNELMGVPIHTDTSGQCIRFCRKHTKHVTGPHTRWKRHYGIHIDVLPYDYTSSDDAQRRKHIKRSQLWNRLYILKRVCNPDYGFKGVLKIIACIVSLILHIMLLPVPVKWILKKYYQNATKYKEKTDTLVSLCDLNPQNWLLYYDEIFPLQIGTFEQVEVFLLHKNHENLTRTYGDYMTLPSEKDRVNHGAEMLDFNDK